MILSPRLKGLLFFILCFLGALAQQKIVEQDIDSTLALHSPYESIYTHLYYLQENCYQPSISAQTIPGSATQQEKEDIAIKIKKVLDGKGIYINMNLVPQEENYKDTLTKKQLYFLSNKEPLIYLEKVNDKWFYSRATIANIDVLYKSVYPFWAIYIDRFFSAKFGQAKLLGLHQWQWVAIVFLALFSILLYFILKRLSKFILNKITARFSSKQPKEKLINRIAKALGLVFVFAFLLSLVPSLRFPLKASMFLITLVKIIYISFITYFSSGVFRLLLFYLERAANKTNTKLDNQVIPILGKLGKILIYFIGFLYILKSLDVNVTAMLAGLSIGGLALALASKDTVQNIIGSLNIFLDRPFEVDDYIIADGVEGAVEEVGIRATRIRTINQSLAYIPNGILSNMTIDNYGMRVYRRWITTLGLDYETPPEKIALFVDNVHQIIAKNEYALEDKSIVNFINMGTSTLDIYVSVFFDVKTYDAELDFRQSLLLEILKMAKEINVSFAFPTQTVLLNKAKS